MRRISTSNGCRSFKSVDCGLRPRASETLLLAPANFPFGEDQDSSANLLELIFSTVTAELGGCLFRAPSAVASGDNEGFARNPGWFEFQQLHFLFHRVLHALSDRGYVSAVNDVVATGYRRGAVGSEERNQLRDFVGSVGSTQRNSAQRIHQTLTCGSRVGSRLRCQPLDQFLRGLRFCESGRDAVHPDGARADFFGESFAVIGQSSLCGGVGQGRFE